MKYVIVETIATFHHKYLVALEDSCDPAGAMDVVTMEEVEDFDQRYLGEQILGYKEVNDEEITQAKNKSYYQEWSLETFKEIIGERREP
jgi:hypothetical protein